MMLDGVESLTALALMLDGVDVWWRRMFDSVDVRQRCCMTVLMLDGVVTGEAAGVHLVAASQGVRR